MLALGKKVMTNIDNILKSSDITLLTNVHIVKTDFSSGYVQICKWDCKEGCALNWYFQIFILDKTLQSILYYKEINLVILREISPEYSWEGLMLKLNFQFYGYLMWRANSLEKNTLMLRKFEVRRRREWQRMGWLGSITDSMEINLNKLWEIVEDREVWLTAVLGVTMRGTCLIDGETIRTPCWITVQRNMTIQSPTYCIQTL